MALEIYAACENGLQSLVVDGKYHHVKEPETLVWEGPSESGKYWFLLAHSGTQGQFCVSVTYKNEPYQYLGHPLLNTNGCSVGYEFTHAVSVLKLLQKAW